MLRIVHAEGTRVTVFIDDGVYMVQAPQLRLKIYSLKLILRYTSRSWIIEEVKVALKVRV
tara:strand:- start:1749 stop:1928 length:180 start_codon:yes stop_codon:yes gene_type:complete